MAQGKSVVHIHNSEIKKVRINYPQKTEQDKIFCFFCYLENLITLHKRKCEQLQNIKKALLEKMFPKNRSVIPEIRFKGFTDAWEQRKLGDMGMTFSGLSGKTKEDFGHGNAEFITYMNIFANPIADTDGTKSVEVDSRQSKVKRGDVLFTTSSETPDEVGMSSVWLEDRANVYLNSFCFGWRATVEIDHHYLAYMLRSKVIRKKLTFLAQGISRYNISKNKVMEIPVPIPSLDEQRRIGSLFTAISDLITLHQRKGQGSFR